ncbi:MAG: type II toxin-antitoxin system RelE/ParE family toxin [Candidatus Omnitrophica bacterium]|nr:type II toxin-antitoxin system RelE/ParE family toxin [Candidatus Omnitrophota bacterium]
MEIVYRSRQLRKICNEQKKLVQKFGPQIAKRLMQRLTELEAAESLEDMRRLPGARCHELTADRKGEFSVDLAHPYRLIFEPDYESPPKKNAGGGLDWKQITKICVLEIVDYH